MVAHGHARAACLRSLAGIGVIAIVVMLAPKIADIKEDNAERDRREAAEARERRIEELKALMRPRRGAIANPANAPSRSSA